MVDNMHIKNTKFSHKKWDTYKLMQFSLIVDFIAVNVFFVLNTYTTLKI